jgi:hypothetical protein
LDEPASSVAAIERIPLLEGDDEGLADQIFGIAFVKGESFCDSEKDF